LIGLATANSSVRPSGFARTTRCVPIVPEAPGTFSIRICWPRRSARRGITMRAPASTPPPAPNGTTTVIGLSGQEPCAATGASGRAASRQVSRSFFIAVSSVAAADANLGLRNRSA